MKPLARFVGAALVGALALLAAPTARAQVRLNVNIGAPNWGPRVPYGTQYYYIPEIDGYYDLYAQQYLVCEDGYWVPLQALYGYDPYLFHPVAISYRGREPWCQRNYYHHRYAYQPYRPYGRGGHSSGYGQGYYPGSYYPDGRGYHDHDDDRGRNHRYSSRDNDGDNDGDDDDNGDDDRGRRGRYNGGGYGGSPRSIPFPVGYGGSPRGGPQRRPPQDQPGSQERSNDGPDNENGQQGGRHSRD